MFKKKLLVAAIGSLLMTSVSTTYAAEELSEIKVQDKAEKKQESRTVQIKDSIVHTDVISAKTIESKQAGSLEQAINNEPGVEVRTECSVCGAKRVSLNGLKGEHTTLMINGVPNSSILESYYGYDAVPMVGVTAVEISRGAGASLIAPEAIGGVINVVSSKPREDKLMLDLSLGTEGYKKYQVMGTKVSKDKRTQMMVGAQTDNIDQYDGDHNGVNESPKLDNHSVVAQIWHQPTERDRLEVRLADQRAEMFGGPMIGTLAKSQSDAKTQAVGSNPGFVGDNVNNLPNTAGGATTARDFLENVTTTKQEMTGKWSRDVNAQLTTHLTGSYVKTNTDDIYEGTTYKADQNIYYIDAGADYYPSLKHALTVGADFKHDKMLSISTGGTHPANDSYDKQMNGVYIRDIWTPNQRMEVAGAIRMDAIDVNFLNQNRQFTNTVVVPRMHIRYDHNFNWTSRFSAGMGYRVPLQFFEAEHGILDDGFKVAVDKLEKSQSVRYELAYSGAKMNMSTSYAWTAVKNLAAIDTSGSTPTLVSTPGTGHVQHADLSLSYQLTHHLTLGSTLEGFAYDKTYKNTFSVIPIETRLRLTADYDGHGWQSNLTVTGIGSRKYSDFPSAAYDQHYNDNAMTESKGTNSPAYMTADVKVSKNLSKNWKVYGGVNNLLDYTQIGTGDSPLYYDNSGTKTWDTGHIWGPLRGRVIYGGIRAEF